MFIVVKRGGHHVVRGNLSLLHVAHQYVANAEEVVPINLSIAVPVAMLPQKVKLVLVVFVHFLDFHYGLQEVLLLDNLVLVGVKEDEGGEESLPSSLVLVERPFGKEGSILLVNNSEAKVEQPNHYEDHEQHEENAGGTIILVNGGEHDVGEIHCAHGGKYEGHNGAVDGVEVSRALRRRVRRPHDNGREGEEYNDGGSEHEHFSKGNQAREAVAHETLKQGLGVDEKDNPEAPHIS
mmetsp:Transcript_7942/g.15966  ORF Transcript_7942/g.15966 Transcript_7942/m.15966 type:complete len:237 (-) Transcript_7942:790-1500(-)